MNPTQPQNPPTLFEALKQGNPAASLANLYSTVQIRTSITPPVNVNVADALQYDPNAPPSAIAQFIKPTVILQGPAGRVSIAPYGEAGDGTLMTVLIVAGIMGVGFLVGRWSMK